MDKKKLNLVAVGDIMLGEHTYYLRRGVKSMIIKYGPFFPFEHVSAVIKKADIALGNLECNLSRVTTPEWRANFSAIPSSILGLKDAGFNIISLANNHVMEHGNNAAIETMRIIDSHKILYFGIGENKQLIRNPVFMQLGNNKVAFLAYSFVPIPEHKPLYARGDIENIKQGINMSKQEKADIVIVSLHWGDEFIDTPSVFQVNLARELVDSGVNVIIGHLFYLKQLNFLLSLNITSGYDL